MTYLACLLWIFNSFNCILLNTAFIRLNLLFIGNKLILIDIAPVYFQQIYFVGNILYFDGCDLGGETAEMPDMYQVGEYDAAGFAVGAVERNTVLPNTQKIIAGDVVIGLASSGVHSNGFSLVRKVVELSGVKYTDQAVFSKDGRSYGWYTLTLLHSTHNQQNCCF